MDKFLLYNIFMYLSFCLIARDENDYLQEWLDYHILLGVEHFWIYDNESAVPLSETLKEYVERGWVTIHTIHGRAMQLHAYDHCLQTYGALSTWIGFIDTDEFIVTHPPVLLNTFLKNFEGFGGFAVSSLFFGHGGNTKRPAGGQIAGYRSRTPDEFSKNRLVKMIVQPQTVINPISPHSFLFKESFFCVNENWKRVDAQDFPCSVKTIQLNHYFTRSRDEWNQKLSRGRGDSPVPYKDDRGSKVNQFSTVVDTSIFDLIHSVLPEAPKDLQTWKKKVKPDSPDLINLLHQAMEKIEPPQINISGAAEVFPRPELIAYYQEVESGIRLYEEGKLAEARDFWVSQISRFPFDPLRYTNFSHISLRLGDFESAWTALAQAWRIAPQSLYVLLGMTEYFFTIGNYAQAEKTSLLCAAIGDLKPEGLALLAISQWKLGKQKEARITAQPLFTNSSSKEFDTPLFKELFSLISK
jgi:hypothetical protein